MEEGAFDRQERYRLHESARNGDLKSVRKLIAHDPAATTVFDVDGRLPIHWAVAGGHRDIVAMFLSLPKQKWDINTPEQQTEWTVLMMAVSAGEDTIFDLIMKKEPEVNAVNARGQTAMHLAASKNRIDFARRLVANGAKVVVRDERRVLPIHRAAAVGSIPIINLCIANKSSVTASDADGLTPLHHAVAEGHGDAALRFLRAGADPLAEDRNGVKAILACPDEKVTRYLIKMCQDEGIDLNL